MCSWIRPNVYAILNPYATCIDLVVEWNFLVYHMLSPYTTCLEWKWCIKILLHENVGFKNYPHVII
jgi:hypothetical protein